MKEVKVGVACCWSVGCGRVPYWGNVGFCVMQIRRSTGKRAGGVAGDGEDDRRMKLENCEDNG